MADLFGLSPEEIHNVAGQRIATQGLAHQALISGANWLGTQEQIRASQNPDLVDVDFNGQIFQIRRQDVPQAAYLGAKVSSDIDLNVARIGQAHATGAKYGLEAQGIQRKQAAIDRLRGDPERGVPPVGLDQVDQPGHFADLVEGAPGVAAGVAQWHRPNPTEARNMANFQMRLAATIDSSNYKPEYVDQHNANALVLNTDPFMYLNVPERGVWEGEGIAGKLPQKAHAERVKLPVVKGKQMLPRDAEALAQEEGISIQELLLRIKARQEQSDE